MTFADWALTDAEKCVRVDLKAWDGSQELSLYIASRYYEDTVNDVEYLDRLIDPLIIRRSMNWSGGAAEASVGAISIDNSDRDLDDWIDYGWHGREVIIRLGDPSWAADDSRWSVQFRGLADKMEAEDFVLTLFTRDKSEKLNRPIVERPLNVHPQAFLRPFPVPFGKPQNVTPPLMQTLPPSGDPRYLVSAWSSNHNPTFPGVPSQVYDEVYENGAPTAKSLSNVGLVGGGSGGFGFSSNDPEGAVTCDPRGVFDDPIDGTRVTKAGEIMLLAFTYTINRESGICPKDGDANTCYLDVNASDVDDIYNGPDSVTSRDTGYFVLFKRDSNEADDENVGDYDGGERKVTFGDPLPSLVPEAGDRYDVVPDSPVRHGPLTASEVDSTALTALDNDAGYDLGIWDGGGEMTYIDLLNTIFPGGFFYYWKSDGTITCGLLKDPSEDSSVFTIDQYESRGKIRLVQEDAPIYRARVGWDRNWTVMTSPDESVSINRAAFLSREYQWELDEDLTVRDAYPEATSQDFPSYILDRADAQTEAERLMDLFGVARKRIMVEGLSGLLGVDLNDVVTLKDDTYGLEDGKDFRVVMMEERPIAGTVDVELWG